VATQLLLRFFPSFKSLTMLHEHSYRELCYVGYTSDTRARHMCPIYFVELSHLLCHAHVGRVMSVRHESSHTLALWLP